VAAIDSDVLAPALHSRHCGFSLIRSEGETLLQACERLLDRDRSKFDRLGVQAFVVLPMEEACVRELAEHPGHPRLNWLAPTVESLSVVEDKSRTLRFAAGRLTGPCRTPLSFEIRDVAELPDRIETLRGLAAQNSPIRDWVIKPMQGKSALGVTYWTMRFENSIWSSEDARGFEETTMDLLGEFGPLLIQERVPGSGVAYGVSALFDHDSELCVQHTHRRLHQYPLSGGPSTLRESCRRPDLESASIALLRELDWVGVAMVEWKQDPRTQEFVLMEINGRFWGSLELAIRAGADFPVEYVKSAMGIPLASAKISREGVRCRWWIPGDVLRWIADPQRENFWKWWSDALQDSEEIDRSDWRGLIATLVFTLSLLVRPRFWRYLRRGR